MGRTDGSQMPPTPLPQDDHIVRYAKKRVLIRDDDENVVGVFPAAFELRDGETYLSVTWLEFFSREYGQGLIEAAGAIRRQLTVRPRDGFTTGPVSAAREMCDRCNVRVRILHEPVLPENEGHSAWRGLPRDNSDLLDLLATEAFSDTREASSVPEV